MKKINGLIVFILFLLITGCDEKVYDIDQHTDVQIVSFGDLPPKVKNCFEIYDTTNVRGGKQDFYSTDSTIEFTYGHGGLSDDWVARALRSS